MTELTRALNELKVQCGDAQPPQSTSGLLRAWLALSLVSSACVSAEPSRPATLGPAPLVSSAVAVGASSLVSTSQAVPSSIQGVTGSGPIADASPSAVSNDSSEPTDVRPLDAATASFDQFRVALSRKDFEAARRWLTTATVPLDASVSALVNGVVSLGLDEPEHALQSLTAVDRKLPLPAAWLDELTAEGHARSKAYMAQLPALKRSASFDTTFRVASRLLDDAQWQDCEVFVNRGVGLADSFHDRGRIRFLRAKMRLAQNRPTLATPDLRWLALSNPHHDDSERAFLLLSQPPFERLNADDQYLRANQLADRGLVERTDLAAETLGGSTPDKAKLADLEYLRGLARYRRRMFAEAIPPLDRAVQMGSHKADHARYLAARATARSGNPQAAIERFKPIARSKPTTKTVTNAAFHIAREHSIAGNWDDAAIAYGEFQARFPTHEYAQLVEQDLLPVWFAAGHYKRVVYWARKLREKDPERPDSSLFRSIEALALYKLGHTDFAKQVWQGLAQTTPLSFAGIVAQKRLSELGVEFKAPFTNGNVKRTRLNVSLPPVVTQLDALGFSRQAEYALQRHEATLVRTFAPDSDAALCEAYSPLRAGRRRYELGFEAVKRRGFRDSPQLADAWLWDCYYPTPFIDAVLRHTHSHPVSPALVYAVMRQESAFIEAVESHAGARGLMQIIDPTARRIAAELKRNYDSEDLEDPERNIEFGAFYLHKLQNYFSHPALVAAAYNAGPEATARWFAAGRSLPLEVFVLRIPYEETRTYVQRVLANLVVYQALAPEFQPLDVGLEFASALNANQTLPDALHATPEDFY